MVHGRVLQARAELLGRRVRHDGDNARSKKIQGGDETFAGRVTGMPFRRSDAALRQSSNRNGVRDQRVVGRFVPAERAARPDGHDAGHFYEPVYVKGHRRRWEADVDWTVGSGIGACGVHAASATIGGQGIGDQDLPDAPRAILVRLGDLGADRRRQDSGRSRRPSRSSRAGSAPSKWRPDTSGCGSTASMPGRTRRSATRARTTIFPGGERALTLGVNWTLNRFVEDCRSTAIREHVEDPNVIRSRTAPHSGAGCSASSSCCEAVREEADMLRTDCAPSPLSRRSHRSCPPRRRAQTPPPTPPVAGSRRSVLRRHGPARNPADDQLGDWASLKEHYLDNTYYPCDFRWHDQTVRNIGIRSRGTGSRSGVKPACASTSIATRPTRSSRAEVVRPAQQHAGPVEHARAAQHAVVPAHGRRRAKRTRGCSSTTRMSGLYTIVESVDKTFLQRTQRGRRLPVQISRQPRRRHRSLQLPGTGSDAYVPLPFKPETNENDPRGTWSSGSSDGQRRGDAGWRADGPVSSI